MIYVPSFENAFHSKLTLVLRLYNSALEMLDKILKLNSSVLVQLAVFVPKEYYASGKIMIRCALSKQTTKDGSSSLLPVFELESTTRTMKFAKIRPDE